MEYQDTTGTPSPLVRSYYVTGEDTARAAASAHHDAAHDARQTEGSIPVNGPSSTPTHDTRPGPQGRGTPLHRKGRPFTCLDNAVIDRYLSTLTGGEWKVYAVLAMHADAASTCFPSVALLAAETGLTPRQVHNCLRSLQAKRLIAVGERYKGPRDRTSSLYTLLVPPDDQRQDHPQTSGVQEEGVSQTPPRLPQTPPPEMDFTPPLQSISPPPCNELQGEPDPPNQIQENQIPLSVSLPPPGESTHTGEEGQGEVSRGGDTADTAATVLEPILALPFLATYRGTALCTPGFWFALCPETISDPNEFFSRLADRLLSLACFLYGGLHWQAAATFIKQEAARMVAVMTFCSGTPQAVRLLESPQQQETAASARDLDGEARASEDKDVYQAQRQLDAKHPRRGYPSITK